MGKKKNFKAIMVCVMVMALSGCASGNEPKPDTLIQTENFSTGNDNAVQNKTGDNMQPDSPKNDEDMTQQQPDTELEEELRKYRQEREDELRESLVREGRGSEWNVIHNGTSYKE